MADQMTRGQSRNVRCNFQEPTAAWRQSGTGLGANRCHRNQSMSTLCTQAGPPSHQAHTGLLISTFKANRRCRSSFRPRPAAMQIHCRCSGPALQRLRPARSRQGAMWPQRTSCARKHIT